MKKASPINAENKVVPITEIHPNEYNPKLPFDSTPEGQKQFARIVKSMKAHGQIDPILVREIKKGFEIVNGYHRYMAAVQLGWKELEIKNLGKISLEQAQVKALATEDAKIALDYVATAKMVTALLGFDPGLIEELPYDQEDAENMQKMLEFDWNQFEDEEMELEDDEKYTITLSPELSKRWKELKLKVEISNDAELIERLMIYEKDA
mgnify:CR=1 FL=1